METTEINGFLIDEFNQHKLEEGKKQGVCPLCSSDRKPKNTKAKIGNVVSVLVIIVIHHFNYIRTNVKELAKKYT
jgi:hypothetical protein